MYDVIIIGAGTAGCTAACQLAEQGKNVLIIEKKNHIAGNCYDAKDEHGVLIHVYGPHIFHTGREAVYEFLSRFTDWYEFRHEVVANVHGEYMPVPFNLHTLKKAYGEEKGKELEEKLQPTGITLVQNNGSVQEVKHYHLHLIPAYLNNKIDDVKEVYKKIS